MKHYSQTIHLFISSLKKEKGIALSQSSNPHLSKGKENLLWEKEGTRLLFSPCSLVKSLFQWLFLFTPFFPPQNIETNSIVRGLRESQFPFYGFSVYILYGNRYIRTILDFIPSKFIG